MGNAATFHCSENAIDVSTALTPYLLLSESLQFPGLLFRLFGAEIGDNCGEIIDFILPATALDADRQALERYISHFTR